MKKLGIYGYDEQTYSEITQRLGAADIEVINIEEESSEEDIDLFVYNVDSLDDFDKINTDKPFIIFSSINSSEFLKKSYKLGALDYIYRQYVDIEAIIKRIERQLNSKKGTNAGSISLEKSTSNNDKLIDIEIKRADRGTYPFALLLVKFENRANVSNEVLIKLIDKMKLSLRESDSCLIYPEQSVIIMLPFADKEGTIIVARKMYDLLTKLGYKAHCLGACQPEEGTSREELFNNFGKSVDTRNLYK